MGNGCDAVCVGEERLYLSAIKDLCTKEIVAHHISRRNDNELVLETFKAAFDMQKDATGKLAGLIVHSDQGFQYTSHVYHDMLSTVNAQISMSRRGNCLDNAAMESFFSHLKAETLYPYHIRSLDEAQQRIEEFIHFYNHEASKEAKQVDTDTVSEQACSLGLFSMSTKMGLDQFYPQGIFLASLNIVIERIFMRMHANRYSFGFTPFQLDEVVKKLLRKYAAFC